jgi:hypothetical protein
MYYTLQNDSEGIKVIKRIVTDIFEYMSEILIAEDVWR